MRVMITVKTRIYVRVKINMQLKLIMRGGGEM